MSASVARPVQSVAYGAQELKHAAHRFGFSALLISVMIHFSIIGLYFVIRPSESTGTDYGGGRKTPVPDGPVIVLGPPIA